MGIARAIERVKRQARQVGFNTVIEGFGQQLRSDAIPAPLRGAAWRIAALLDAACPGSSARPGQRARELIHSDRAATGRIEPRAPAVYDVTVNVPKVNAPSLSSPRAELERPMPADRHVSPAPSTRSSELSATALDSGEQPEAPVDGTPVNPVVVGATPSFNATPVEAAAIDATPADEAARDVRQAAVEIDVASIPASASSGDDGTAESSDSAPALQGESAQSATEARATQPSSVNSHAAASTTSAKPVQGKSHGGGKSKRKRSKPPPAAHAASGSGQPREKEKLAPGGEEAKTLARSDPRPAKRRSGAKADISKKK